MPDFLLLTLRDMLGGGAFLILLVFLIYDKFFSKRYREHRKADIDLINVFKETIDRLEKNQGNMQDQMDEMEKELLQIKKENEVMVKIFQGRDDGMIKYQQRGLEIMDKIDKEIIPMLVTINQKIK